MMLQEFAYQTVIDGVSPKLSKHKKSWLKFLVNIGNLMLQSLSLSSSVGKEIYVMNLGEEFKRMHGPVGYLAALFAHEHMKFQYIHENNPNDSMF